MKLRTMLVWVGILVAAVVALLGTYPCSASTTPSPSAGINALRGREPDASLAWASDTSVITPGVLTFHEADSAIAYDWFTYVPHSIDKTPASYILMTGLHGNITSLDYDEITDHSRQKAEGMIGWAETHQFIILVPVVPRGTPPGSNHLYPVAFDLDSFLDSTDPFYRRPDLKINLMIDKLIGDLRNGGYNVHEKVLVEGFSAGGQFSQRYALLHPERTLAIAAGSPGGTLVLPETHYGGPDGVPMNYAVGVNDFSSFVGRDFDRETYRLVPQFVYIGDQDTENGIVWEGCIGEFWTSQAQIDFLNDTFGATDPVRMKNQAEYLRSLGYNITFKLYPGVGHQRAPETMDDMLGFFRKAQWPFQVFLPVLARGYVPSLLPIEIDGDGADWSGYAPLAIDPMGDTFGGPHTDLKALFGEKGPNYLHVMVEVHEPPLESDAIIQIGGPIYYENGSASRLMAVLGSDGSQMIQVDQYDDNWQELDVTALSGWGDVMELRLPLSAFGNPTEVVIAYLGLAINLQGEFEYVDEIRR